MDTIVPKTPATLPFATWQAMPPAAAAREVHTRLAALPAALRAAALAWIKPEAELALALAQGTPEKTRPATADQPAHLPPSSSAVSPSPLRGLPFLVKDLFDVAGVPTRAGSTFLDQVRPTPSRDAQLVQRLQSVGAVCAGKTHLVEFASGLTGENPHYGDCPHPQFPDRLSGGSSSGSAALVAAGVVPLAIGTDTGGSVRVPSAFSGLYGFRGTPRHEWIADAFPLAPTLDTAGWFTGNATDMRLTWQTLVGGAAPKAAPRGCHVPLSVLLPTADGEFIRACDEAAAQFCPPADAQMQSQLLAAWQDSVDAYLTIGMSEAHAVHRNWLAPFRERYDPVVWQRFHDAGEYPVEKITRARATLEDIRAVWRQFFLNFDYLILPAAPSAAPRKVDCTVELRRSIIKLNAPASLGGLPVLSIPVPLASGLTGGLQIIVPLADSPVIPWILNR